MAVVKADGYGHGSVAAAYAALEAGATWLGVALVEEGVELRDAGIDVPILLLSQPPVEAARAVVDAGLTPVVHSRRFVDALAKAAADAGAVDPQPVHLKVDTGMHRIGCSPSEALDLAPVIKKHRELQLQGLLTHFAVADEPDNPYTARQVARFEAVRKELARLGIRPSLVHAANSAGVLTVPEARYDLVRCGISIYGIAPAPPSWKGGLPLRPALSLKARVSYVRHLVAGERLSYGLRYELDVPVDRGHRPGRLRRRRPPPARRGRRRGPDRRAAQAHRRHGHDGPAARRPGPTDASGDVSSAPRSSSSAGRATTRSPPPNGRTRSGRSPTRSAAASGTAFPAGTRGLRRPGETGEAPEHHVPSPASGSGTGPGPTPASPSCWAPSGTVGSGEVRGGAPATRETALLEPGPPGGAGRRRGALRRVGLRAGRRRRRRPVPGRAGPGLPDARPGRSRSSWRAALFDLPVAQAPGAEEGWAAAVDAARGEPAVSGRIGAGRGATVGKWRGREHGVAGGLGTAAVIEGGRHRRRPRGLQPARRRDRRRRRGAGRFAGSRRRHRRSRPAAPFENTTLVVVATDARLGKAECHLLAQSAHDGLARAHPPGPHPLRRRLRRGPGHR